MRTGQSRGGGGARLTWSGGVGGVCGFVLAPPFFVQFRVLRFVERPRYSAEGGIGASRSRIQCALGGLHSATRPIGVDLDS
jgi:hypothetical protein